MSKIGIKSLSTKIVFSIMLIFLFSIFTIFTVFEKMNREAFYNVEMEKANIIAKTIEPLIALNIYLDMTSNIDDISHQLLENKNILAVEILKNNEVISEIQSQKYHSGIDNSFIIKETIFNPNSKKKIGTIILTYSTQDYKELLSKYTHLTLNLLFILSIIFILFSFYVKKLLSPLKDIAKVLKYYSPNKEIEIPFISQNNEIGLISNALNNMQNKISQYSKKQQNINQYLEEKVDEKTLELRKQLFIDTLTGLPNRHSLLNDIITAKDGALLVINIDDFKEINDFFGHIAGDNVLINFSNELKSMLHTEHKITLNRLSGDEFAIFYMEKPPLEEFIKIALKLIKDVEKMIFFHENNELAIRITIGGTYQIDGGIEKADIALKLAKKRTLVFFNL